MFGTKMREKYVERSEIDDRSRWKNCWIKVNGIKWKRLFLAAALGISVCGQIAFPVTASAATKEAIEKAVEAFSAMEERNGAEAVAGTTDKAAGQGADGTEGKDVNQTAAEGAAGEQSENTTGVTENDVAADGASSADSGEEVQTDEAVLTEEELRQEIVDFALQFEGNPYVYGGTSLTNGADCSGFVMSVFAQFGYALPRVAADQYYQCEKKDISDLEPGDLVFYGSGISHVALYIGNGQIIHASTAATGIKISNYDYETPVGVGTYIESDTEAGFYSE